MGRLTIDGSMGEGGGQVLRTSLALSVVTGTPFLIENIRSGRKKPGLMRQHRTAVQAAKTVCRARVDGDELGSQRLTFEPGAVQGGEYRFSVGTAGSACLVLQTVLPPLLTADRASRLVLEGGTHNPWAPPFDFLARTFVPLLARMGARVTMKLERPGFYPAGGGRFVVEITPGGPLQRLDLVDRGELVSKGGSVLIANLPEKIAERERDALVQGLGWPEAAFEILRSRDSIGPGNVVMVEVACTALTELFTAFGQKGVPVREVVGALVKEVRAYLASDAPVGVHLADQLLIPMAMAGAGTFRTRGLSQHATTNIHVIEDFLDARIRYERHERGDVLVEVRG